MTDQNARLADSTSWLGSAEHLKFLAAVVHEISGLNNVTVIWVPPGDPGFWEAKTRTLAVEQPVLAEGVTPQFLAKMTLIGVLHETLHARYSSPTPMFQRRMRDVHPLLVHLVQRLFNFLEDGRITALGKATDPGLAAALDEHLSESVKQLRRGRHASAETQTPADARQQLLFALDMYALTSQVLAPLHPAVEVEFRGLQPTIDATRTGSTDDCGVAAIKLAEATSQFQPAG